MIDVEYGNFRIVTDRATPGTFKVVRSGKGSLPVALTTRYTSLGAAKYDIDMYIQRNREADSANKTRATRRSK